MIPKPLTGVLLNPRSGRVRKRLNKIRRQIAALPDVVSCEASSLAEINQAIDNLIGQKIDLLVIIAGDGTVQAILNYYFSIPYTVKIPKILIVAGGTTNMTAKDIGIDDRPDKTLKKTAMLLQGNRRGSVVNKAVLRVSQDTRPDIYGMFFAAGIIVNGAKFFQKHLRTSGITGEIASFIVVVTLAVKMLFGGGSEYLRPIDVQIQNGQTSPLKLTSLLLFATTLDRLLFGLRPYWGMEHKPIHFTCIRSNSVKFWRSMFAIIFNRGASLRNTDGYFSSNNQQLSILLNGDFLIDGEIFHADSEYGALHFSLTQTLDFIVP